MLEPSGSKTLSTSAGTSTVQNTGRPPKKLNDEWLHNVLKFTINGKTHPPVRRVCSTSSSSSPSVSSVSPTSSLSSSGQTSPFLEESSSKLVETTATTETSCTSSDGTVTSPPGSNGQSISSKEGSKITKTAERDSVVAKLPEKDGKTENSMSTLVTKPLEPPVDCQENKNPKALTQLKNSSDSNCHVDAICPPEENSSYEPAVQQQGINSVQPAINLETEKGVECDATVGSETNDESKEGRDAVQIGEMGQSASSPKSVPKDAPPSTNSTPPSKDGDARPVERQVEVIEYHDGPRTRSTSRREAARLNQRPAHPVPDASNNQEGHQEDGQNRQAEQPHRFFVRLGDASRWIQQSARLLIETGWNSFEPPAHIWGPGQKDEGDDIRDAQAAGTLEQQEEVQEEDEEEARREGFEGEPVEGYREGNVKEEREGAPGGENGEDAPGEENRQRAPAEEHQREEEDDELDQPNPRRSHRPRRKRTLSLPLEEPKKSKRS